MPIRLEQIHPVLVHAPIVLLPLSVVGDFVGRVTHNSSLVSFGQKAGCIAAVGAVGSAVTGLIAGEEVNVEGASMDMLMTHRNLNLVATIVATSMAMWRVSHRRPGAVYLATGMIGIGVLAYTSYLGGKLVYEMGAGVQPAHGVYRTDAPVLKSGQRGSFLKAAGTDFVHGVQHMVQEVKKGNVVPTITATLRRRPADTPQV